MHDEDNYGGMTRNFEFETPCDSSRIDAFNTSKDLLILKHNTKHKTSSGNIIKY